jgi:hypothetical protein
MNPIENVQALPFITHVNSDGSDIGGSTPKHYAALQGKAPDTSTLFVVSGSKQDNGTQYSVAEWAAEIKLPELQQPAPVQGNLFLSAAVTFDGNLFAFELDSIITFKDKNNKVWKFVGGSAQLNFDEGGHFQINNKEWDWIDTDITIGIPLAGTPNTLKIGYALNTDLEIPVISIVSFEFNGKLFPVPANLWLLSGEETNWTPDLIITQFQFTLKKTAVASATLVDSVSYTGA